MSTTNNEVENDKIENTEDGVTAFEQDVDEQVNATVPNLDNVDDSLIED